MLNKEDLEYELGYFGKERGCFDNFGLPNSSGTTISDVSNGTIWDVMTYIVEDVALLEQMAKFNGIDKQELAQSLINYKDNYLAQEMAERVRNYDDFEAGRHSLINHRYKDMEFDLNDAFRAITEDVVMGSDRYDALESFYADEYGEEAGFEAFEDLAVENCEEIFSRFIEESYMVDYKVYELAEPEIER